MRKPLHLAAAGVVGLVAAGSAPDASAFQIYDLGPSTCTTANCGSTTFGGTVNGAGAFAGPWIGALYAGTGECLRLDVTSQQVDLEIVAVAPSGAVFRNDDRAGPADRRPLVKINGTQNGWYTVQVSEFAGSPVQASFTLAYGRYNLNNPNCSAPTGPLSAREAEASKGGGNLGPAVTGGPGR
jgi:hypothetical protein